MNKKFILLSLLLLNLKIMCGENLVIRPAVACEISYCDKKIQQLSQPNIRHYKYGFESDPLWLSLNEKHERGVLHMQNNLLQRVKISKEQVSSIIKMVKENIYTEELENNQLYNLKKPIYVTVKTDNSFIFYKIKTFRLMRALIPTDEAGYRSDTDLKLNIAKQGILLGIGIGGISTLLLMYVFKKIYYS